MVGRSGRERASSSGESAVCARRRALAIHRDGRITVAVRTAPYVIMAPATGHQGVGSGRIAPDRLRGALERVGEAVRFFDQVERATLRLAVDAPDILTYNAKREQL